MTTTIENSKQNTQTVSKANSEPQALAETRIYKETTRLQQSLASTYSTISKSTVVAVVYDAVTKAYAVYLIYQDKLIKLIGVEKQIAQLYSSVSQSLQNGSSEIITRTSFLKNWLQSSYVREVAENACFVINLTVDQSIYLGNLANSYVVQPSTNFVSKIGSEAVSFYVSSRKFTSDKLTEVSTQIAEQINSFIETLGLDKEAGLVRITTTDKDYIEISIKKSLFVLNAETFETIKKIIDGVVEEAKKRANNTLDESVKKLEFIRNFVIGQYKHFLCIKQEQTDTDAESEN